MPVRKMPSFIISDDKRRWLPHEIVFGGFLFVTWLRLAVSAGLLAGPTLAYAAFLAGAIGVMVFSEAAPSQWRWRLRLAYYPLLMNVVFIHLKTVVPLIHPAGSDGLLQDWDRALLGGNLSLWLEPLMSRPATELASLCYCLFFPYLVAAFIRYLRAPLPEAQAFYAGLFTLYGIGFLGYTLLPAHGPYAAMAGSFTKPVSGYFLTDLLMAVYPLGTNGADVFPSLHCAVSAYILGFDAVRHRPWFRWWLLPVLGLWLSTVYLRFHYGIDVLAGLALAVPCLVLALRFHQQTREKLHALRPALE
jgi:membrane-associated phospholipid phosphatase